MDKCKKLSTKILRAVHNLCINGAGPGDVSGLLQKKGFKMSRSQLVRAGSVLGAALASVAFNVVAKGNDFSVTAQLSTGGGSPVLVDVCDDSGKIRVFKDMDDFFKAAAKVSLVTGISNITYTVNNIAALEPAVFTGDIVARTNRNIASYNKQVIKLTEDIAQAQTGINLLPASTAGEIAYKAEKVAQKAEIEALKTWLLAEVARLTALLA